MIYRTHPSIPDWFRDDLDRIRYQQKIDAWVQCKLNKNPSPVYPHDRISGFTVRVWIEFRRKCLYCERLVEDESEVRAGYHRPWESALQDSTSPATSASRDHYRWLGWDWANIYLVCKQCSDAKKNIFPVRDPSVRAAKGTTGAALDAEHPLLLDPCHSDSRPHQHLVFSDDGSVVGKSLQGQWTVRTIDLDRDVLRIARRQCAQELLAVWQQAFPAVGNAVSSVEMILGSALNFAADDAQFAGMCRQLLHRWLHANEASFTHLADSKAWTAFRKQVDDWNHEGPNPTAFSQGYALLIGVGQTREQGLALPVSKNDARAIRDVLVDPARCAYPKDNIRVVSDEAATAEAIKDALKWLAKTAVQDSTVLVYFSGHGTQLENGDYYLIPHDAVRNDIANSALSSHVFTDLLRKIKSKRLLVILDCCHAGGMAVAKSSQVVAVAPPPNLVKRLLARGKKAETLSSRTNPALIQAIQDKSIQSKAPVSIAVNSLEQGFGRAVLSSSQNDQKSWYTRSAANSLFTIELIRALDGAYSHQGEQMVWLYHLMHHLCLEVPLRARELNCEQQPYFEVIGADFPVALIRGGKGISNSQSGI